MAFYFSPVGNSPWVDSNGDPLVGGYWSFFLAGTSTPVAVYTNNTGTVAQPADLTLQSNGMPFSPIWLQGGIAVKARLFTSAGVAVPNGTFDNISGIDDPAIASSISQWVLFNGAPTYVSATSFTLVGDQTVEFQRNRRIRSTNTGGTVYSTIASATFAAGVTTVTVYNETGALDSGMSVVSYGLISAANTATPLFPVFSAYLSATQSVNSSTTPTVISLDAEEFDTNATFNTSTYRHAPNIAGYYQYTGRVSFASAASGLCGSSLRKNGALFKLGQYTLLNSGSSIGCVVGALIYMNGTTDYVELAGFQTSGGAINVGASNAFNTYLQGVLVRPG